MNTQWNNESNPILKEETSVLPNPERKKKKNHKKSTPKLPSKDRSGSLYSKIYRLYSKNKSPKKNLKPKEKNKSKVKHSLFFMLVINANYMLALICMALYRDGLLSSGSYVKILVGFTTLMVAAGIFFLPHRAKHYGLNLKRWKFNLGMGLGLGLIGVLISVFLRFKLIESGRTDFAFRTIPEWEFFIYPLSVFSQETMTRGFLQTYFHSLFEKSKLNDWIGIGLSSLIFGLMHLMYGFEIMGLSVLFSSILGYFYNKSGSILGVCITHFMVGTALFYFKS